MTVYVKNSGASPALRQRQTALIGVAELGFGSDEQDLGVADQSTKAHYGNLAPGEATQFTASSVGRIDPAHLALAMGPNKSHGLFLFGTIWYHDVFQRADEPPRRTRFCYEIRMTPAPDAEPGTLVIVTGFHTPGHNDAT